MGVEVLAVDGCNKTAKVHKALALRDADNDALIVTVTVRPEHRIANLVHLLLPLAAFIAASCSTTLPQALAGVKSFFCSVLRLFGESHFHPIGVPIGTGIARICVKAFVAVFLGRRTNALIHAFTATPFVAILVGKNKTAAVLTANRMGANDKILLATFTLFRHVLPPLEPSSMRAV
jgi:hypothetical protein